MSTLLHKKLLRKHSKPVDKQVPPIPIAAENLQKIAGVAARAIGPAIGRALGAGAKAAKPQLAQAGKTALDTAAVTAGADIGHAASKKFNQKTGLDKQNGKPSFASKLGQATGAVVGGTLETLDTKMKQKSSIGDFGSSFTGELTGGKGRLGKVNKQLPAIATQDTPTQRKQRLKNISNFNSKIMPMLDPTGGEGAETHSKVSNIMEGPASKVAVRKQSPDSPLTLLFEFLNKQKDFDKSAVSDAMSSSKLDHSGHYSDKEKEQRKKDAKFWEEKNLEYLKEHPEKRGGR